MSLKARFVASDNNSSYGYTPSLAMSVVFLVIFGISTAAHVWQSFRKTSPRFMILMAIGGAVELIGWGGRVWSRYDWEGSGYIMQICCLVIAPTFYSAALYVLLGLIINMVAPEKSPLTNKMFKILFITADVFSLVLQGAGGGIAATAITRSMGMLGSHLMLAGIVVQLVVMLVFVSFGLAWAHRASPELRARGPDIQTLLWAGLLLPSVMIVVRGCYRTGELSQGFSGSLARDQLTFLLDAIPISIATVAVNVWHPNRLMTGYSDVRQSSQETFTMEMDGTHKSAV